MCGITGYWNFRSGQPATASCIRAMTRCLVHRGPDDEGYWIEGSLAMGIRRLKVVDLEGGRQPMANEDGSIRVVFNGEIYNHAELRRELERRGHQFRTRSDAEAIVHAYEEWDADCVARFNGMFAIAVWDARRQRLLLARDRLGIKPLYIYEGPHGVVFGSELKAVITAPWVPVEWDIEAVDDFMTYEYVPAPRSIVQEVGKLLPGTLCLYERVGGGRATTRRYWQLHASPFALAGDLAQAEAQLRERLLISVRRRLMADVPLGAFLSGGIDSSIIVALMGAETPGRVRSFSLGFADRSYDELRFSRMVAKRFATSHREERVSPEIVQLAGRLADYFDEPFGDVSAFPTFMISELVRREATVALSGDGGDELFAGYDHYRADRWAGRLRWLARRAPWQMVDAVLEHLPPTPAKKGPVNKAKRFVEGLRRPEDLEHARWWVFWGVVERRATYEHDFAAFLGDRDPFAHYRQRLAEGAAHGFSGLARQLYADVTGYLPDDILVKLDRMSMAVSLEARVPFLDHEVVEYAMALPAEWKLRAGTTKWILKRAFGDVLPSAIRRRGKEGFSIPMKNWLRRELRPMLFELLDVRRIRDRGWFVPSEVSRLVDEHSRGHQNHAHRLWCLMSLELSLNTLAGRAQRRERLPQEVAL